MTTQMGTSVSIFIAYDHSTMPPLMWMGVLIVTQHLTDLDMMKRVTMRALVLIWIFCHMWKHAFRTVKVRKIVCDNLLHTTLVIVSITIIDPTLKFNRYHHLIQELQQMMSQNNEAVLQHLDHINSLLHNAVLTCKAATISVTPDEPFEKQDQFAPGQKLQHQWRFSQTTKTPGRKKRGTVLRYVPCQPNILLIIIMFNRHANKEEQMQLIEKLEATTKIVNYNDYMQSAWVIHTHFFLCREWTLVRNRY